jgi:polyphenol oxidase
MNPPLLDMEWELPPGVAAACTTRLGGVSQPPWDSLNLGTHVGDDPQHVATNRAWLRQWLGLEREPVWLSQVHGTEVAHLDELPEGGGLITADAAVTGRPGVACVIMVADCLPVLFSSRDGSRVGAAHAGWRGLATGVLERTVDAMGLPGSDLRAWLGPRISQEHFEVGEEVREVFVAHDVGASAHFERNANGRWQADLGALAKRRLSAMGVEDIADCSRCTFADRERFFSHRRDGKGGRMAALIWQA